jgi:D-alanyl-D-alanine carboxypeptidase (penicillin-binding protein 5/6)
MQIWALLLALVTSLTALQPPLTAAPPQQVQIFELAARAPAVPAIKARSALLVDLDTRQILFQLNRHGRLAPASLTKVVTALVALDELRLDRVVTVPASINQLPWDSTRMGLRTGERVTVRELLYGLFLNSGNDAAITLSEALTSRAAFAGRMNAKAAALGMRDSHFVNPVGLDDPAHLTSAADLATAAMYLEDHDPEVAAFASIPAMRLPATATHHAYSLYNLNQMVRTYPGANGLKTGWTGRAGGCLIATAARSGRHLMVVLLGSPRIFDEAAALLDYGFASPSAP